MILIFSAMTTCPRSTPYWRNSLESVAAAGFNPRSYFDTMKRGSTWNFRQALTGLIEEWKPGNNDALVVFQDDIEVSKGLFGYLHGFLWPENPERIGVLSLYTAAVNHGEPGWYRLQDLPHWKPYGALGIVMPALRAREFIDYNPEVLTSTDSLLGQFCREKNLSWWTHSPSFVRHTGKHSAINEAYALVWDNPLQQKNRQCKEFLEDVRLLDTM